MRLEITCDPAKCLAAGFEPVNHIDIDVTALPADQRALVASIMQGTKITPTLDTPTLQAIISKAQERAASDEAERARKERDEIERAAKAQATIDLARQQLADRKTQSKDVLTSNLGMPYSYSAVTPVLDGYDMYGVFPAELKAEILDWRKECETISNANKQAAEAEAKAKADELIAKRAAMTMTELQTEFKLKYEPTHIISDNNMTLKVEAIGPHEKLSRIYTIDVSKKTSTVTISDGKETYETRQYKHSDGVVSIDGSTWLAVIADPSAAKPVYNFTRRVPGGYEMPDLTPGDILVWGGKDKKGRKTGPFDRLVYAVDDTHIRAIAASYVILRRLRKIFAA